jgi:hypothetical protein
LTYACQYGIIKTINTHSKEDLYSMKKLQSKALTHSVRARRTSWHEMLEERSGQPWHRRLGKVGLYKTVGRVLSDLMIGDYVSDPNFIAGGSEQLVFKKEDGKEVSKLLIATVGSSAHEAAKQAKEYQALSDTAQTHIGEFWTDTEFRPVSIPTVLGRHAVAATQPLVPVVANFAEPMELYTYHNDDPEYMHQQQELLARIRSCYRSTEMLPDLLGAGNVVTAEDPSGGEVLRVVDTIPETPSKLASPSQYLGLTRLDVLKIVIGSWADHLETVQQAQAA